jgi:phage baseplate assembly protein W
MTKEELFGQDIRIDGDLDAALSASGEMIVTTGARAALQDIKARVETPLGGLFYDTSFGSRLVLNMYDEITETVRQMMALELEEVIERDPRVVMGSVTAEVTAYDERSVTLNTEFILIQDQNTYNLVVEVGKDTVRALDDYTD